jgi:hypothetical protein
METFDIYCFGEMEIEEVRELVSRLFSINFSPRNGEHFGEYYNAQMLTGEFIIRENADPYDRTPMFVGSGVQRILLEVSQVPDSDFVMDRLLKNCPAAVLMEHDEYPDE